MSQPFPPDGRSYDEVVAELNAARSKDKDRQIADWKRHTFLYTFHVNEDVARLAEHAYLQSLGTDALSAHTFPSVKKFREDVIGYAKQILGAPEGAVGVITTGGTESIILSMKCARDWARAVRPQIKAPEVLCPVTAHPAFNKAADLLGFTVVRVPVSQDCRVDMQGLRSAITTNTIALVGSAPNYWYGVIDPIEEIAGIAHERDLWMHVDACVGGFLGPFARKAGFPVPAFEMSVAGVRSISADLHKYGYSPKGASVALFRDRREAHNLFRWKDEFADYVTPGLAGTRGGGAIAATWAVQTFLGEKGFVSAAAAVMRSATAVRRVVEADPDLYVPGNPQLGILTFGSRTLDIAAIASGISDRGWMPNVFHEPPILHLRFAPAHESVIDDFIRDLRAAIDDVRRGRQAATIQTGVYTDL